ncbi:TldD/PmbA family protein [Bdellovibrio sp. HCB209]|uniref:TldD/PmbA family protein n=1 Tax=Bdellovibrio sp. HCB209 TaxID=3394354 RepID=UPI0039B3E7FB
MWNISQYQGLLDGYTELRAQENRRVMIVFNNGNMTTNSSTTQKGISARVFQNGGWGFAFHPEISKNSVDQVLKSAKENAQFMSQFAKSKNYPHLAGAVTSFNNSSKKTKWTNQETIEKLKEYDNWIETTFPSLTSRRVILLQETMIKDSTNSHGAINDSNYSRGFLRIILGMKSEHGPVTLFESIGGSGEIEDIFPDAETFQKLAHQIVLDLTAKAEGVIPTAGKKEVVLSAGVAGVLAHEAIGHTTEADLVIGGSIAGEYLNQSIASPLISIIDYAHTAGGKPVPMPVYADDEGTLATDTTIIENGILKTFMNSKSSAQHFDQPATGHARAWGFNDEPMIRMRNTVIAPGTSKLADMISSIEDGYYLVDNGGGQADSTSEFMFVVHKGYEIKNGKLGRAILNTTVSGVAFDMLKSVTMVSDDMQWDCDGTCGKMQPMIVGMGGPAIKCHINIGGK